MQLRPDQERVTAHRKGYMAVPAVPGAGKTTVLAWLAADLIASGAHEPGRVLVVTYTNSAVANFRSRIGDFLELRGCPRSGGYEVRTIHSLALYLVRERPDALGWSDGFTIIDEVRGAEIMERLTAGWVGRNQALWESLIKPDLKGAMRDRALDQWQARTQDLFRTLIQTYKSRKLSPDTAAGLTRHLADESVLRWAAEVYGEYQRELAILGAVDFGDLMLGAHRLLSQDGELLARLQKRWSYLFEDEAQDSYRLQEDVLRLLAGPEGNLVRVGDANQAIMGTFTSAEPDLFRRFCHQSHVALRPLTMAGRSAQTVIDLANELVRWVGAEYPEERLRAALEPQFIEPVPPAFGSANPRPEGYTIRARIYPTLDDELAEVSRLAARSAARSPDKTLAVLLPTNGMVVSLLELLAKAGVEARQLGGGSVPERQATVLDLLAMLAFLGEPHRPERLLDAVSRLAQAAETPPYAAFLRTCNPAELFYPADGAAPFAELYAACPEARADAALEDALALLARWLKESLRPADELAVLVAGDLGLTGEPLSLAHHLALRTRLFLQANPAAVLADVVEHLRAEELTALGRFADLAYDRKGFKPLPGVVYVTTCHSAKGLEWDTVFVAALTRGEFPGLLQDKVRSELWFLPEEFMNPEALAVAELSAVQGEDPGRDPATRAKLEIIGERLRLLYVAITRARENLLLSCHQEDRWNRRTGPSPAFVHLARFIDQAQRLGTAKM
ncbi:MAG TPA: ATP-dependent helicase [Symbiobacteriaceae bacterium]|jgi:DNA helicase-2/ATP-dependent DNA helicase PcrA